ncbi:SET domain-containing protein [Mytilinidion resinicola]|uniref:SET domain-containing protein n=1 Tax=Mytilinidion resinicola TaxID=574789 RepID=A0A6A6YQP3_9PEZI|nr:SET domain-containing protein [Mytilinidion resinicola]KAF2810853.1 SET domain-containing protein [Mytilinidion resinicola]
MPIVDALNLDDDLLEDAVPWSHEPVCTSYIDELESELCVYTIASFDRGRGISIFTTPRIAEEFAFLSPFREVRGLGVNDHTNAWYTEALPGKGIAMLAKHNVKSGELLSAYTPALLVHMDSQLSTLQREKFLKIAVNQLPAATRDSYLSLTKFYNNPMVVMHDVLKSNTFEMEIGGHMHLALIPEPSRMNHDCAPNAQYYLDGATLTHVVHATRDIGQDEEITIAYSDPLTHYELRHRNLEAGYHFSCQCKRCQDHEASDAILTTIKTLTTGLEDWTPESTATTEDAERVIQLFQEQGLEGFLDVPHGHAAMAYSAVGNLEEAAKHAKLAAEVLAIKMGPTVPGVADWEEMAADVKAHWSWGKRKRGFKGTFSKMFG